MNLKIEEKVWKRIYIELDWRGIVQKVQSTIPHTKKEIVEGTLYEPELQLAKQTTFHIIGITAKNNKVKCVGYIPAFNECIPQQHVDDEY